VDETSRLDRVVSHTKLDLGPVAKLMDLCDYACTLQLVKDLCGCLSSQVGEVGFYVFGGKKCRWLSDSCTLAS
jgi:hypothetical protein